MTVQEVRNLDDDEVRASVQLAAKGGDDHASTLLFFWAQWHKINTTKGFTAKGKVLTFANLMDRISKTVQLNFTYGR